MTEAMTLRAALDEVRLDGARMADVYDADLARRFAEASADVRLPMALVATGGWARRELAPHSDIDFIVLHDGDEATAKTVADRLLYPLWDEKLAVGHAIRTPRAASRLGDLASATALLDARLVAGDAGLFDALEAPDADAVIAQLRDEMTGRHARFGATVYLLEPNLKQGIGALRDLATALWTAQLRFGPRALDELVAQRHLTARQGEVLANARAFMLRIRAHVQLQAKRRFDQLTFEIQEAIAPPLYPDLGPDARGDGAVAPSVEALMQAYFRHARGVEQVVELLLAQPAKKSRAKPLESFVVVDGELAVEDVRTFPERPSEMVRLFRVASRAGLPIAAYTRELVAQSAPRVAHDPTGARLLREAIADPADTQLGAMHQLGLLNALMPEWAPCTARVQHDLYHVYTVDQHQLYALAMQKQLARGELPAHALATDLWREVKHPVAVFLATLLHDVGKPAGKGHAEKGAVLAGDIARRLGMSAHEIELVEFLVRQHLTMSHISQRRDLSDLEVIARFADKVIDDEHLVALYLVTLCDTAMTAPGNLTAWKADLLRELLVRTRAHLRGELHGLDALTPDQLARGLRLVAKGQAWALEVVKHEHHTELVVVAPDAPGTLATLTGALAAHRVDVLGAIVGHVDLPDGRRRALDTFFVRDGKGAAIAADDPRWPKLAADLSTTRDVAALIQQRRPPSGMPARVTPEVATEIRLHDDASAATIVEVTTRDRVGVLHVIARALADAGLDISLAKVATEGERVHDAFYVTRGGARITDATERAQIVTALEEALA